MTERFVADGDELDARDRLAKYVDTELARNEQETGISFFGDADRYQIISYKATLVRKILKHDYAEIEWVYGGARGERLKRIDTPVEFSATTDSPKVEGICATMPLGTLTIKGSPRKHDRPSEIVSTPREIEGLREAFE